MRRYSWPAGHWGWLIPVTHKHGIRSGPMAYVGGQVDKDINGLVLHHGDLGTQTRVVVNHIRTVLGDLGIDLDDIVKLVAFYVNDGSVDEDGSSPISGRSSARGRRRRSRPCRSRTSRIRACWSRSRPSPCEARIRPGCRAR